jgi:hypothetical protein
MGQTKAGETTRYEVIKTDNRSEQYVLVNSDSKKLSYSRLLADLTERDIQVPLQKLAIETTTLHHQQPSIKPGGVIYELDEEHEYLPEGPSTRLPMIKKAYKLPKGDTDNLQKRLKKIQDKFIDTDN